MKWIQQGQQKNTVREWLNTDGLCCLMLLMARIGLSLVRAGVYSVLQLHVEKKLLKEHVTLVGRLMNVSVIC